MKPSTISTGQSTQRNATQRNPPPRGQLFLKNVLQLLDLPSLHPDTDAASSHMEQSKLPLLVDDLPHSWFGSLSASWEEMSTYIVNTWTILLPLYWAVFTHHYCIILYILNISSTNIGTDTYYPINHNRKRDKITSVQLCIVQSVALLSSDPFSNHTPKWPGAKWGNPSVPMSSAGEQP